MTHLFTFQSSLKSKTFQIQLKGILQKPKEILQKPEGILQKAKQILQRAEGICPDPVTKEKKRE